MCSDGFSAFLLIGRETATIFSTGDNVTTGGGITPPELDEDYVNSTSWAVLFNERMERLKPEMQVSVQFCGVLSLLAG